MVLTPRLLAAALLLGSCVPRLPVQQLSKRAQVAVAYVVDRERGPGLAAAPQALKGEVIKALSERNLEAQEIPFEAWAESFRAGRDSKRRLSELRRLVPGASHVLLVEAKASFFSQLSGRYRWLVSAKLLAAGREGSEEASEAQLDLPTFLDFAHEREAEAIASAAPAIAQRAGSLMDAVLGVEARLPDADAIYFVLVDRFANGDSSNDGEVDRVDPAAFHGGDLTGLIDRLDELEGLGVGTLWLSPAFQMRGAKFFGHGAFHGYWVEDLGRAEPRFGGEGELKRLSAELRRRKMRLVLDLVLNHLAPDAPLTRDRPEWFHRRGSISDWNDPVQLTTHDVHGLPDLAEEREDVYRYLLQTSSRWVRELRPYGFRLDAVKHMPLSFWARFNQEIRAASGGDLFLLGEMLDGNPQLVAQTQREGRFGAMFDFPLYFALIDVFCRGQSPARLGAVLSLDRLYDDPSSLVTLLDNHDLPRVLTDCGGDRERVKRALTVQLTWRGTPSITYGTEAELSGEKEPENRGDMRFGPTPVGEHVRKLLALRRRHPALRLGVPLLLEATESFFAYARVSAQEAAVVAVNNGDSEATVQLPRQLSRTRWTDAMGGRALERLSVGPGEVLLALASGSFAQLAQEKAAQWRRGERRREVELQATGAERLWLVGSPPELGGWEPSRGVPVEEGRARLSLPVDSVYEYKLVQRPGDGRVVWEIGGNRLLLVSEGQGAQRVQLSWRGG